ncbi:MAG: PilW family protein [Methylococcales bacterium]|nr:PilW family protein [Methylococcales bacterium]
MKNKQYQTGLSLIEIMIALLIGVFLLGGILQIFIGSKQTYKMQENLSRLQENGRFALDFLGKDLRSAGYRECLTYIVPTSITGTNDTGLNTSDTVIIKMSRGLCGANVLSTITYSIQMGAGGQPALFKKINSDAVQEVIEGIENMQIFYGADTNVDGTPNYYVPAGTVGLSMAQVVSIRITLTVRTIDVNLTTTGDGRIRRNFTSTIALRNRLL